MSGGVTDGQAVSAAVTNPAFIFKNANDTAQGQISFDDSTLASGTTVTNIQKNVNSISSFLGWAVNAAINVLPSWVTNNRGSSSDDVKDKIDALDIAFSGTGGAGAGHVHDGTSGNGPNISASALVDINYFRADLQVTAVTTGTGSSTDVTSDFSGLTPGGGTAVVGVITTAPNNDCTLRDATTGDEVIDSVTGNVIYGRVTFSGSTWTLSYYTDQGSETPYSFLLTKDILCYFKQVFNLETIPTIPAALGNIGSLNATADVVDASTTQRGVVSTGTQSFAGNKTFTGTIGASNLSGTNSGDVTLAAVGSSPSANGATLSGQVLTLQPADGTRPGLVTIGSQTIAGLKSFSDGSAISTVLSALGRLKLAITTDSSTTGSNAAMPDPATSVYRLTNASLTSIQNIGLNSGVESFSLVNATGATITIQNNGGGTTAQQILTGTNADISLVNNACISFVYDTTSSRWRVVGATAGGSVTFDSIAPTTTKGDTIVYGGGTNVRLPVGTNGQAIVADSTQTNGLKWGTPTYVNPTIQTFSSGSGATYTRPTSPTPIYIIVEQWGGGGGGGASGASGGTAGGGGTTTFNGNTSGGGGGGNNNGNGPGAGSVNSISSGTLIEDAPGLSGGTPTSANGTHQAGGAGGGNKYAGPNGRYDTAGQAATARGTGGAGGGSVASSIGVGAGGGGGSWARYQINSPASSYTYTVGAKGSGASLGTNGTAGGDGNQGGIQVFEYYQ